MDVMEQQEGYFLEDISVGIVESLTKTVSAADVAAFADITGDTNPIHLDEDYAAATPFKARIAHGILTAGLISAVIGTRLPGPGCIYMSQTLKFRAPVRINDQVVASVRVTAVDQDRGRVTLETQCHVGDTLVLDGEALMKVPRRPS